MSDTAYNKTMESLRNRVNARLVNNEKDYLKCSSKPSFTTQKLFNNDLVAIHKIRINLTLSKQAYVGMCIIKLSKLTMYEFHYVYIRNKYGNISRILFKYTDSLMHDIKTENVYDDFKKNKEMFEFSNYSAKSKYYDDSKELYIGKMKNKMGCVANEEFAGLKPTMYSILVSDSSEYKKDKKANAVN